VYKTNQHQKELELLVKSQEDTPVLDK